jgi:LmbE family N-acetylglucosaminyl deacetylase
LFRERPQDNSALRKLRRHETHEAARVLGAEFLGFLGWEDYDLENVNILSIEREFVKIIRREKPDVIITFHASGISYHPDHRVVALALNGAFQGSAHPEWYSQNDTVRLPPHQPSKLYYYTVLKSALDAAEWPREVYASSEGEVTTVIDTTATADIKWEAIKAHATQRDGPPFTVLYEAGVFAKEAFVRVFPSWRSGDRMETDLLEGLATP